MIKSIIFDIDGTLAQGASWQEITRVLGGSVAEHMKILADYRTDKLTTEESVKKIIELWETNGPVNKEKFHEICKAIPFREGAEEVVKKLQEKYQICLISGALDLYVETVAERLGIEDWYAGSQLVFNNENYIEDFIYVKDQSQVKLQQFTEYANKKGIEFTEAVAVGDGDNDILLFQNLAYGIYIKGLDNPELVSAAARHKITELKELLDILN
jgi:phosphoserine phosphatase